MAWWRSRARLPWAARSTQSHGDEDEKNDDDGDGKGYGGDDDKKNNDNDMYDATGPRDLIRHTAGILH